MWRLCSCRDTDNDGIADSCDVCPNDENNDSDGDGVCGDVDICEGFDDNLDTDGDGLPNGCDETELGDIIPWMIVMVMQPYHMCQMLIFM